MMKVNTFNIKYFLLYMVQFKKVAFLTTIFPVDNQYINIFFDSLLNQTNKEFDIVVVNDNYLNFDKIKTRFNNLNIIELKGSSSIAKNREKGLRYIKKNNYDVVIFGDIDDYFKFNRINKSLELLETADVVVNDIDLFNRDGIICTNYFSSRLDNLSMINIECIMEKNLFGLTNTAINVSILSDFKFYDNIIAVDWYLFSILLLNGARAVFTNETSTCYRQHGENVIGMNNATTSKKIKNIINIKKIHYQFMSKIDPIYIPFLNKYNNLAKKVEKVDMESTCVHEHLLWWEEV